MFEFNCAEQFGNEMLICCMLPGTGPTHEFSGIRNTGHECSVFGTKLGDKELYSSVEDSDIPKGPGTEVNSHYGENLEDRTFSGLCLLPVEKSSEVQSTSVKLINNEARVEVGVDLTEKINGQVIDLDVEAVLERQETHDLYCPNCNSCITRRIILRKRKRKVQNLRLRAKHDKYEMTLGTESATNPANAANQGDDTNNICSSGSPTNADEGYTADREVDIFRCLSCFTIFIPSGNICPISVENFICTKMQSLILILEQWLSARMVILNPTCFIFTLH